MNNTSDRCGAVGTVRGWLALCSAPSHRIATNKSCQFSSTSVSTCYSGEHPVCLVSL